MSKISFKRYVWIVKKMYMAISYYLYNSRTKSIYFSSMGGRYADSPRCISEYIHCKYPQILQYWECKNETIDQFPKYVYPVKEKTLHAYRAMARASAWVITQEIAKESGIWKSPKTYVVNTWHGDRGFKAVGRVAAQMMGNSYVRSQIHFKGYTNLFIAGSDYGEQKARNAFGYEGEILKVGIPRNDRLINNNTKEIEHIKQKLGIKTGQKVLLYAPTFRDNNLSNQQAEINIEECIKIMASLGEDWIFLIRAHSKSKQLYVEDYIKEKIINVSSFPDMADLLLVCDCLLTDYSSCAGDFILKSKPVILCLFNIDEYRSNRALIVNPDETGYLIAHNQEELNDILRNLKTFDYVAIKNKVNSYYGTIETGNATMIISQKIVEMIGVNH